MEPANLKPDSTDDAQVEAWLRAHSTAAPLPDDGFSDRVLASLPPAVPAAQSRPASGGWIYGAAALLGLWVASRFGGSFSGSGSAELREQVTDLVPQLQNAAAPFTDPGVLLGLVVTIVSLAFVYRRELVARLLPR